MAVGRGPSMAGNVLQDRQHAALLQPFGDGAGDRRDLARLGAIGPVADHGIGAGDRHVRQRQAVDIDAEIDQVGRDQRGRSSRAAVRPSCGIDVVERAEHRAGRIDRPVRRPQPLHPAAFLVDQDRRVGFADQNPAILLTRAAT